MAGRARDLLQSPEDPWHLVDLVSLQGLIAHQRGEWFERFRMELRRTQGKDRLATALFDAHLCVAEYLLYGPVPYSEVIAETEDLRRRAAHAGALRGVAFATALLGEAALLMGDLDRAERELTEAVDLHREIDASAGEAHSLQRLAEVRLARGDREDADRLLRRALPLARFSVLGMHLLHRVYGSMIAAAPDPVAARAVVDRAEATMGEIDHCIFCSVMLEVPSAIACADVGDLDERAAAPATRRRGRRRCGRAAPGRRRSSRRGRTSRRRRAATRRRRELWGRAAGSSGRPASHSTRPAATRTARWRTLRAERSGGRTQVAPPSHLGCTSSPAGVPRIPGSEERQRGSWGAGRVARGLRLWLQAPGTTGPSPHRATTNGGGHMTTTPNEPVADEDIETLAGSGTAPQPGGDADSTDADGTDGDSSDSSDGDSSDGDSTDSTDGDSTDGGDADGTDA